MNRCDNCGITNAQVRTYVFSGSKRNKMYTCAEANICDCCYANGIADDEEKVLEMTGLDALLYCEFDRSLLKNIANYIIETGTENTTTGNWNFGYDELARVIGVSENAVRNSIDAIVDELCKHDEFCWDDQTVQSDYLSVMFWLEYCPDAE